MDREEQLRKMAPLLNGGRYDPLATPHYDVPSDALIWSDELPLDKVEELGFPNFALLRGVFRYRSTLIMGKPDERHRSLWEFAASLFPQWAGFAIQRQSSELRDTFLKKR